MRVPLIVALALAACAPARSLPEARAVTPRVTFQQAEVEAIRADRLDARLRFAVHNPYHDVVGMESLDWTLELAGVQTLTGTTEGPDFDDAEAAVLDVPVSRDWDRLGPTLAAVRGEDGIPWRLTATAEFDLPNGTERVPVSAEGVLPFVPPPAVELVDVRPITLGERPTLALVLDVVNVPRVARLDYALYLSFDQVTDGVAAVSWSGDRLTVPVVVDEAAIAQLREGARLRFVGTADVQTPHGLAPVVIDVDRTVDLDQPMM